METLVLIVVIVAALAAIGFMLARSPRTGITPPMPRSPKHLADIEPDAESAAGAVSGGAHRA